MRSKIANELNQYISNDPTSGKSKDFQEITCIPYSGPILKFNANLSQKQFDINNIENSIMSITNGTYVTPEGGTSHYVFIERRIQVQVAESANKIYVSPGAAEEDKADLQQLAFLESSIPQHILTKIKRQPENFNKDPKETSKKWRKLIHAIWAYTNCIFVSEDKVMPIVKEGKISSFKRFVVKTSFSRGTAHGGLMKPSTGYSISAVKDLEPEESPAKGVSVPIRQAQNSPDLIDSPRKRLAVLLEEAKK